VTWRVAARHRVTRHVAARHCVTWLVAARHRVTRHVAARHCVTWHCVTWHCVTWHCVTRHCVTWHRVTRRRVTRRRVTRRGVTWHVAARHRVTRHCVTRHCVTRRGVTRHRVARYGGSRQDAARHCVTSHGVTRHRAGRQDVDPAASEVVLREGCAVGPDRPCCGLSVDGRVGRSEVREEMIGLWPEGEPRSSLWRSGRWRPHLFRHGRLVTRNIRGERAASPRAARSEAFIRRNIARGNGTIFSGFRLGYSLVEMRKSCCGPVGPSAEFPSLGCRSGNKEYGNPATGRQCYRVHLTDCWSDVEYLDFGVLVSVDGVPVTSPARWNVWLSGWWRSVAQGGKQGGQGGGAAVLQGWGG
jgi:hypothetical protein